MIIKLLRSHDGNRTVLWPAYFQAISLEKSLIIVEERFQGMKVLKGERSRDIYVKFILVRKSVIKLNFICRKVPIGGP